MIAITHVNYIVNLLPMQVAPGSEAAYLQETRDVEFYTAENSKIGMTGGGMVAYFIENRTIVNLDGLINSAEYFKAMKAGKAQAFLDKLPLNYVYGNEYVVEESDPYGQMLKNRLVEIGVIHGFDNFTLYHYIVQ